MHYPRSKYEQMKHSRARKVHGVVNTRQPYLVYDVFPKIEYTIVTERGVTEPNSKIHIVDYEKFCRFRNIMNESNNTGLQNEDEVSPDFMNLLGICSRVCHALPRSRTFGRSPMSLYKQTIGNAKVYFKRVFKSQIDNKILL